MVVATTRKLFTLLFPFLLIVCLAWSVGILGLGRRAWLVYMEILGTIGCVDQGS